MSKITGFLIGSVVVVVAGFFVARWLVERASPVPDNLGVANGSLAPCPDSPNCVSTFATDEQHAIEPLTFTGETAVARERLLTIINQDPLATLVRNTDDYIHAEYRSALWRFIDDVEFLIDEETGTVHFRSASRLGYSDMGANRERMETIRAEFNR